MSDPGPYQSRLLNLLVPQYRRLVEKGSRAIRQMQVAASWAAQVVIYPVYLLLQTTRVAFRQLGQAVKAQLPQLQASVEPSDGGSADRPIKQVLLAVLREAEEQEIAHRLRSATPKVDPRGGYKGQVIRGLATELTSKNIVLVTADNQQLNIFTPSQQKKIKHLIIWQLAKYWRHQRQQALGKRPLTWGKLAQRKTTILPIRLLGQVMAWVQQGTVARTIDLFGESSLVHQPRKKPTPEEIEAIAHYRQLDSFIAALEGHISIRREGRTREITASPSQTSSVTDGSEREKQNIFALLGAAIAYFFGSQGKDMGAENSVEVKQLTGSSSSQSEKKEASPVLAAGGSQRHAAEGLWGWQAIKNQLGNAFENGKQVMLSVTKLTH